MRAYPTPVEAALEDFGVSDARAMDSAVDGDHAAVIALAPAYDPPVTLLYRVTRGHDGWRVTSGAPQQARPELLVLAPGSVGDRGTSVRVFSERASSRGPSGWAGLA